LTIRNIPEDAKRRFRQRAASHGRSMEEEARQIILAAVNDDGRTPRKSIGQMLYEASRPGFDLPEVPDTQAGYVASTPSTLQEDEDWVHELIRVANGAGEGVFDREVQQLREFDL
jgi:plasmid stability protein